MLHWTLVGRLILHEHAEQIIRVFSCTWRDRAKLVFGRLPLVAQDAARMFSPVGSGQQQPSVSAWNLGEERPTCGKESTPDRDCLCLQASSLDGAYLPCLHMQDIKVGDAASKGRGLFAGKDVTPQHTLYTANELVIAAINTAELPNFCYRCYAGSRPSTEQWYNIGQYRDAELKVCTGCQVARFCGERCQKQAWKRYHKHECKIFAKLRPKVLPEQVRAVLAFLLQHDNALLADGHWSEVMNALSHADDLRAAGGDTWMSLMLIAKAAHEYSQTKVDLATVLKLVCILKVNGLQLSTTYGDPIGIFLDPTLVKINHSCNGNVMVHRPTYTNGTGWPNRLSNDKAMLKLFPLRDIEQGEELTISYIDFTEHVTTRQKNLQKDYLFTCTCDRCNRDTVAAKELSSTNSDLAKQQVTWREEVNKHFQLLKGPHFSVASSTNALESVIAAMESQPSFSPSTDPYPRAIHELKLLHMDNHKSVEAALMCALKEHLLVGPAICTSPFYPTRIVNAIYLLQILALLDDCFTPSPNRDSQLERQARSIEKKGLSRKSFKSWRLRICVDTRACLLKSGLTDLTGVLEMEQMSIGITDPLVFQEMLSSGPVKQQGEEEMMKVLGLSRERWDVLVKPGLVSYDSRRPGA